MDAAGLVNTGNITEIAIGVIVALVVIGAVLSFVISAIIMRVLILAVVLILGVFVWQQRGTIRDRVNTQACKLDTTFFGIHVDAPARVDAICQRS